MKSVVPRLADQFEVLGHYKHTAWNAVVKEDLVCLMTLTVSDRF